MTSGLVGEMGLKVLPNIAPWFTLLVTLLSMMVGYEAFSFTPLHATCLHAASSAEGMVQLQLWKWPGVCESVSSLCILVIPVWLACP